jgi:hypothetical protein
VICREFVNADLIDSRDPAVIAERRRQITAEMARVAKASEASLPIDQRRQVFEVPQALAVGGTVQHTAGPTWQQRAQIAAVLAVGLPLAISAAYVASRIVTTLAGWAGALLA